MFWRRDGTRIQAEVRYEQGSSNCALVFGVTKTVADRFGGSLNYVDLTGRRETGGIAYLFTTIENAIDFKKQILETKSQNHHDGSSHIQGVDLTKIAVSEATPAELTEKEKRLLVNLGVTPPATKYEYF